METIDLQGVPHAYELTPPTAAPHVLVFVHGWLLSRHYWQPLVKRLSPEFQCLTYDLRGFGDSWSRDKRQLSKAETEGQEAAARLSSLLSERAFRQSRDSDRDLEAMSTASVAVDEAITSAGRYDPASYAQDLELLLKRLNISTTWLIGHSLGGSIALWGAERLGCRVKGVIGLNSGGGIYLKEEFERFRQAGEQMVKVRPAWLPSLPFIDLLFTRLHVAQPLDRVWGRQRVVDFVAAQADAALGALLESTTEQEIHRLPQLVARLNQPAYFITGSCDTIMEPRYVRHLASFHSSFQAGNDNVIEIPNCGHLAMVEHPDTTAAHLRRMMMSHSA